MALRRTETENMPTTESRLLANGWTLGQWRCPCGSCDPEEAWLPPSGWTEDDEDEFLFDADGNLLP